MSISYGYFNSINGDRTYNADQMSEYYDGLVSNGVYESVGNALQVKAITGQEMAVQVGSGRGIINCKWIKNDAAITLDITQAHAILNRYTAVVMKLDVINRLMTITTKDGTPASNPDKPAMQNDAEAIELCLAYIYVAAGATSISQANIEDMRPSALCGWVTGLIEQVDTSELFLQWQTAYETYYATMTARFEEWFDTLTEQLNVNTYIRRYYKRVVLESGDSNVIPLDMSGYTFALDDIVDVFINGLHAAPEVDYYIDQSTTPPSIHPIASGAGTEFYISVLKSKIGFSTLIGSDNNVIIGSDNADIIGG